MHESLLQSLGLSLEESGVYEKMLELGVAPIQKILPKSGLKRGTLYNVLRRLVERGLLTEKTDAKKATFEVASPVALEKLIATETAKIEENKKRLGDALPQLASLYNLAMHKPNVQFFEGLEGVQRVVDDALTSTTEIYTYLDSEAVDSYIAKINLDQKKRRSVLDLKKKIIEIDSSYAREKIKRRDPSMTETRVIPGTIPHFATIMQIYESKVSYITLDKEIFVGIIIEDSHIATMHRIFFEYLWSIAKKLSASSTQPPTQAPALPPAPALASPAPRTP